MAGETKVMDIKNPWCFTITEACERAVDMANQEPGLTVEFDFNGTKAVANPGDTPEKVQEKWSADMDAAHQAWINSDEYKQREAARAEQYRIECAASMKESAKTETEMRDAKVPTPRTPEQLSEYIASLVEREHDYGTCVYAMSLAATATFNYISHKLGVTGFQAGCADLDFLRRTRGIKGPFMIIKGENALYPQYDLPANLYEAMEKWKPWMKEEAIKLLAENESAAPEVIAHWKKLAGE